MRGRWLLLLELAGVIQIILSNLIKVTGVFWSKYEIKDDSLLYVDMFIQLYIHIIMNMYILYIMFTNTLAHIGNKYILQNQG